MKIRTQAVISDMDGVIYRGKELIPGAQEFVNALRSESIPFLFLTNNSEKTATDLKLKLEKLGIYGLTEDNFITSAMATAAFLKTQKPNASAYVIGGSGLMHELYDAGYSITDSNPDYVVVGKTTSFTYDMLKKAACLISQGARFIGTNPDIVDPVESGTEPACGSLLAAIEAACGIAPYIIGKPNSLMMTIATRKIGVHADDTLMIGDRMDTDIVGGLEAGMQTCLVLSGVSEGNDLCKFPYRPDIISSSIAELTFEKGSPNHGN